MYMYNPPHPGEILKRVISWVTWVISDVAKGLYGISRKSFSELVKGKGLMLVLIYPFDLEKSSRLPLRTGLIYRSNMIFIKKRKRVNMSE